MHKKKHIHSDSNAERVMESGVISRASGNDTYSSVHLDLKSGRPTSDVKHGTAHNVGAVAGSAADAAARRHQQQDEQRKEAPSHPPASWAGAL